MSGYYRCYLLNDQGSIADVQEIGDCWSDQDAMRTALSLLEAHPEYRGISLWNLSKKIFETSALGVSEC